MLAPRHLIFTALEGALVDSHTGSFSGAEEGLSETNRRRIPLVLLTSRTRAEIEPIRRKLEHNHPFVTEYGGGIFFPDGYFNLRIPEATRIGRYLAISQGRPYAETCAMLDEVAEDCGVGVVGFHDMNVREVAGNTGLRPREAELAKARDFDEPFYFTSADEKATTRFAESSRSREFDVRRGHTFWHFSSGCDPARAVRSLAKIFREATRTRLRLVGIGAGRQDFPWLKALDTAILLPGADESEKAGSDSKPPAGFARKFHVASASGPAGWNETILNIIRELQ